MSKAKKPTKERILVPFSKKARKEVIERIKFHYGDHREEEIWNAVERKYYDFLKKWHRDLGGKGNFHNGKGGTYDCILFLTYYSVYKDVTNLKEIEELEESLVLGNFRKMKFVDCNKVFWKRVMYFAFKKAEKKCHKWNDYRMVVAPYCKGDPIQYQFHSCPVAEFAKFFELTEAMPALCNVDYKSMELLKAKLIRSHTCVESEYCDYTICGDKDPYCQDFPEYRDEKGFRRNEEKK